MMERSIDVQDIFGGRSLGLRTISTIPTSVRIFNTAKTHQHIQPATTVPYYHTLPGGTVGYPAHPRLIRPSVIPSVCHITFKFSAENRPGPTDLVKYNLKNVNCREL